MNTVKTILILFVGHPFKMASTAASRCPEYQGGIKRFPVPDDKVDWSVEWQEYTPVDYTAPAVAKGPVWADPDIRL